MYCEKCGAQLPEGTEDCPVCAQKKADLVGQVFEFCHESGMSSRSVTEINHKVTLQEDEMTIVRQKSLTVFRKRSKPPLSQTVKYREIKSVEAKTNLSMVEVPIIVFFLLLALVSGFSLYSVIWLILAALAVKSAIQTVISIHLRSGAVIRIPYSAQQAVSAEFIDALNTVRQYTA